jgi:hypothetical protein
LANSLCAAIAVIWSRVRKLKMQPTNVKKGFSSWLTSVITGAFHEGARARKILNTAAIFARVTMPGVLVGGFFGDSFSAATRPTCR